MGQLLLGVLVRAGDAFLRFYATYLLVVLEILAKIGVRKADMPDITQQVFLKVHKNFEKVPEKNVEEWLVMICRQQAAEHYRLHRNRFERPEPNVGVEVPDDDDTHEKLERHELDQIVRRVLASMDAALADVLVRHEFNGESLERIAAALGMARNTAQKRLMEAKRAFRREAEKLLGAERGVLLGLAFGMDVLRVEDLSLEFVESIRLRVWQGLAHELGFAEVRPRVARGGIERLVGHPVVLLGVGALGGLGGAALWPRETPTHARPVAHVVLPVVTIDGSDGAREGQGGPAQTVHALIPTSTVKTAFPPAMPAPMNDRDTTNLDQARELVARGDYAEALVALRRHEREFPRSEHVAARSRYIALAEEGLRRKTKK